MNIEALQRLARDEDGNLTPMFALTLLPVLGLVGITVDYSQSSARKAMLDSIADSAALAAVTPAMLASSDQVSINTATTLFNSQAPLVKGVGPITLDVTAADNGLTRTVTVNYQTTSSALFGGYTGKSSLPLSGSSQSSATVPPNIDFYLLLDNSPSMAIAATTVRHQHHGRQYAGPVRVRLPRGRYLAERLLRARTQPRGHAAHGPAGAGGAEPDGDGAVDRHLQQRELPRGDLHLQHRLQHHHGAHLEPRRRAVAGRQHPALRGAVSELEQRRDHQLHERDDPDQFDHAQPGRRHRTAGDTPQEVLFIVTDGVEDQMVNGSRVQSLMSTSYCTTIKNRGIRIAVLYTTYLPLPTNSWYNSYIKPFQPKIGSNLQSCASPGLYFQVSTDQDISGALAQLFNIAVETAHLTR